MEVIFTFLYPIFGLINLIAYLPQIKKLIFTNGTSDDISLNSWVMWTIGTFVSVGYAYFSIGDYMLTSIYLLNLILCVFTTGLIIYNRFYRFKKSINVAQTDNI